MDDARKAVQMFIAESYDEALHYAEMLHMITQRKKRTEYYK